MRNEQLLETGLVKELLRFELRQRSLGKPIQIVSDFDETECSTYIFSRSWNIHVPKIKTDISQEAKNLVHPICIATARAATELVSWVAWHKLSRLPMPLVTENGAVLVWPSNKITQKPRIETLASKDQIKVINEIQKELQFKSNEPPVPAGHEVILRSGRIATIEIRAQEIQSKKGTPDDYEIIFNHLQKLFKNNLPLIEITNSGNSLGIQPKGINKELGLHTALIRAGISLKDIFLIGLGDNKNDASLFNFVKQNRGLTVGVKQETNGLAEFVFNGGDEITLQVLKTINSIKQQ